MRSIDTKSQTLNLRVSPGFKQALRAAADKEQRSMVNMLEVLLSEYCERKGIVLVKQETTKSSVKKQPRANRKAHIGAVA